MKLTLKQARLLSGLTQKEVAHRMKVHVQTYMKWEKNPESMSIKAAKQFSQIVGCNLEDVFFDKESNLIRHNTA